MTAAAKNLDALQISVADAYGVHPSHILRIRRFEKWKPVAL